MDGQMHPFWRNEKNVPVVRLEVKCFVEQFFPFNFILMSLLAPKC